MYNVLTIARFIINYCNENDIVISNLKLQKLLYFIQAYFLITFDKTCFRENIEAWDFGPVIPEAYHEFKQYGSGNIPKITRYIVDSSDDCYYEEYNSTISNNDQKAIEEVIEEFKEYTATDLVKLTHSQDPWKYVYTPCANNIITTKSIKDYFNE